MDQPISSDPANPRKTDNWYGWPAKDIKPATLTDDAGRTVRIRTPVMDLEGLITPTNLHYTVQHFAVPSVVETDTWELKIVGEVKAPLTLNFDQLRRFPGRSVRTVMECSGSDATFFEYLGASEWTGVPLAAVLHEAGLTAKSLYVRAAGNDLGLPPTAAEGTKPFYYDKGLPIEKALHPTLNCRKRSLALPCGLLNRMRGMRRPCGVSIVCASGIRMTPSLAAVKPFAA